MNLEQRRILKQNLDILLRRKVIICACLLLGLTVGLGVYLRMPKIYQCAALIKYQRQSVNPTAMSPDDIRTSTKDAVNTVIQEIMSRSSLESVVREHDLYPELRSSMPMEDLVDLMRAEHIKTEFRQGGDVFEVSFQGSDQNKVLQVTNTLAEKFIEENLRFRQEMAAQTSTYVKDELEMAKKSLDRKELVIRDYKLKYYNEMPDQLANNMSRLNALQEQYQNNQVTSHELERTRIMIQEQTSLRQELFSQLTPQAALNIAASSPANAEPKDLNQLRVKLQSLRTRYTDKHPEVKRLEKMIRDLETQQGGLAGTDPPGGASTGTANLQLDPQGQKLQQQLSEVEINIARLKEEREVLGQQIQKYEKWIAAAPIREAEWSALTRDYDQLNAHYQKLVTQSLQADSAQSLENQLKGSQFKIVDAAHFPENPFKPNFRKIMLLFAGIGLAAGGAIALGAEFTSTSFKDPADLEAYLKVPMICAVPIISTGQEIRRQKMVRLGWSAFLVLYGLAIAAAIVYLWNTGLIVL